MLGSAGEVRAVFATAEAVGLGAVATAGLAGSLGAELATTGADATGAVIAAVAGMGSKPGAAGLTDDATGAVETALDAAPSLLSSFIFFDISAARLAASLAVRSLADLSSAVSALTVPFVKVSLSGIAAVPFLSSTLA